MFLASCIIYGLHLVCTLTSSTYRLVTRLLSDMPFRLNRTRRFPHASKPENAAHSLTQIPFTGLILLSPICGDNSLPT